MKKIILLALVASFPCAFGGCASSDGSTTSAADAYNQAVSVRDQVAAAKASASTSSSSATSTKDAAKQAVKDATADTKAKVQTEVDAWKAVVK